MRGIETILKWIPYHHPKTDPRWNSKLGLKATVPEINLTPLGASSSFFIGNCEEQEALAYLLSYRKSTFRA